MTYDYTREIHDAEHAALREGRPVARGKDYDPDDAPGRAELEGE